MDIPSKIAKLDPAKLAFALLIISLFLPWFTVSMTTSYESKENDASLQEKEVFKMGLNEISSVNKEEYKDRNGNEGGDIRVFTVPVKNELLNSDSDIIPQIYLSAVSLKGKIICSIIILAASVLNNSYGRDEELTKTLLIITTVIMFITIFGFLMDIRDDYVTDTGAILAESGDEKIEMNYFAGYSSINSEDLSFETGGQYEWGDREITARWHPSIGFILGFLSLMCMTFTFARNSP